MLLLEFFCVWCLAWPFLPLYDFFMKTLRDALPYLEVIVYDSASCVCLYLLHGVL